MCGKHPRMASIAVEPAAAPGRRGRRRAASWRCSSSPSSPSLWGLWEGYRWLGSRSGWTWPFAVDATTMPHIHDMLHAFGEPLAAGRPAAARLLLARGALHREGGAARLRDRRGRRLPDRRAARALAPAAARPAALRRRLADGADPRDRADGRHRPRRRRVTPWIAVAVIAAYLTFFPVAMNTLRGLHSADRARARADALLRRRAARCSGSCACPPRCRSSSRR